MVLYCIGLSEFNSAVFTYLQVRILPAECILNKVHYTIFTILLYLLTVV